MQTTTFLNKCEVLIRMVLLSVALMIIFPPSSFAVDGKGPTLEEKIGQMVMVGFRGLTVDTHSSIMRDIEAGRVGGVILFDYDVPSASPVRNIKSPGQVKQLVASLQGAASTPLFVAIDQEGGRVCRLKEAYGFPPTVSAQYLGSLEDVEKTRQYADVIAGTLASLGINLNCAPVVDLNTNPDNPVIGKLGRSFSADPVVVARQAIAVIDALHDRGILSAIKHFPGHGSSRADSHKGFVDITDTWSPEELIPYDRIIKADRCDMIMTAHVFNGNLDPEWIATLSSETIHHILREYMGYEGVIISDDMQMGAIRDNYNIETAIKRAVLAGVDILLFANNSVFEEGIASRAGAILERLVSEGILSADRIDASYRRIMELKERLRR
ncbi:MAG: glycoside hydrolase family 3 protein [Deltaproteobacteria bacterium]|nr:glycoside hydrolase family 3 protein [Deltaproteobacteria bacterium]